MPWDIEQSKNLYNIGYWDNGYFSINEQGHLVSQPCGKSVQIDLVELTEKIKQSGLELPVLVRFSDILVDRVRQMYKAFEQAKKVHGYQGSYLPVYPIKVNQQRSVVETLISDSTHPVGLEAGSKSELLAVLALAPEKSLIVCNGYKDREFIRLALIGRLMGQKVFIVIEKPAELNLVLQEAKNLNVKPLLGLRTRLASIGYGKWQNTGGEKGKFGLGASQVIQLINDLSNENSLDALKMLHVHLGSQIPNIRDIRQGISEAARYFVQICRAGAEIEYIDVGGGLGVDYEGSRTRHFCSVNYSLQEYANHIIHALYEVCQESNLSHPAILTESGRAMTAHHAVLISNVVHAEPVEAGASPPLDQDVPLVLTDLKTVLDQLDAGSPVESYQNACYLLSEGQNLFKHGLIDLKQRAQMEDLYFSICKKIRAMVNPAIHAHREIHDELNDKLATKYFCNFSLFQSIPDAWAIDQIFPIVPLQMLNQEPTERVVIEDLTCDSDGRIDYYVSQQATQTTLPLHPLAPNQRYLIGIFMVGAYQEILGDLHNLFGDTNSVDVKVQGEHGYVLQSARKGDTAGQVLQFVNFDAKTLLTELQTKMTNSDVSVQDRSIYMAELESGLNGYTYFED